MKYEEQLIYLVMTFGILYFGAQEDYDNMKNRYYGIIAIVIFISLFGSMRQSTPFSRFRYFWRFMLWLAVTYNAFLLFIFFQNGKEVRQLMKLLDSNLGVPTQSLMDLYDNDCDFHIRNIWEGMDHYFMIHCTHWTVSSLILRDGYVVYFWQILDEILEMSWQHVFPHFRECWWDKLILDMLIGNTLFIILGFQLVKLFKIDHYDWLGRYGKKSIRDWEIWSNYHHFGATLIIVGAVAVNFLNGFFLMTQLWIPPKNWTNIYRILVWVFMGNFAFRELWNNLIGQKPPGQARFLVGWTCTIESFISLKFFSDSGYFRDEETPMYLPLLWLFTIIGLISYYFYLRIYYSEKRPWTKIEEINKGPYKKVE